jgi:hypothetical protein
MDNLASWAVEVAAVAVGLMQGLAIFSVRPLARLLHRFLWSRPEVAPQPGPESRREEPAGMAASRG